MTIVTGDRYLEHLVRFVERNVGSLLDGSLTLKLNPVGLHYVHTRLEALQELEGLIAGAPVDYLRAYVSDLGDHRALEQLRRILGLLTALKVFAVLPPPGRDPTPLSLLPFGRLKVLELRGCDLSTSAAKGLLELRHTLEKLICYNSTDALRHVFASRIVDIKDSPIWKKLRFVSCACNNLVLMDESLQLLPVVETLDLSRNRFAKVDNLRKFTKLRYLDLGFNHLQSIALLSQVSCQIVKLVLRNNALTSMHGIENLKSLEGLDLSYNIISSFTDLEVLASFPSLCNLWLEGNPISCSRWYRAHVFSFFSYPEKLELDGKGISTREFWERHVIFSSNQKKPAGYGFYFPAKDVAYDRSSIITKKKKYSRLASIEDDEQRRLICSDQESVSYDSDNLKKEDIILDNELRSLINKAKCMKNEQSVVWLQEFKEYMDRGPEEIENINNSMEFNLVRHNKKNIKCLKSSGSSSMYVTEIEETTRDGTSSSILESDVPFRGINTGDFNNGIARMAPSMVNGSSVSLTEISPVMNSETDKLKCNSIESQGVSPLQVRVHSGHGNSPVEGYEVPENVSFTPLATIDKIIGSRPSSLYPSSPPHYKEDILHRRLDLEEEFLQHSADANSLKSSDSDTSSSGGSSYELSSSISDLDSLLIQAPAKQGGFCGYLSTSLNMEGLADGRHEKSSMKENNVLLSVNSFEQESNMEVDIRTDVDQPSCAHGLFDNCNNTLKHVSDQEVGQIEKQKGKWKLRRRLVSLPEDLNTKPELAKPNGISEVIETDWKDAYGKLNIIRKKFVGSSSQSYHNSYSFIADGQFPHKNTAIRTLDHAQDDNVIELLQLKVANFGVSETLEQVVCCDCIFQLGTIFKESEVAILRSCENKLYVFVIDVTPDGQDVLTEVLGCHKLEDMREVVIGLGLQALRLYLEGNITYLFLTRSSEKSKNLLSLLQLCDSAALSDMCSLKSWEQVQVKMLEEYVCGILNMGIFLYSMLLFWHDNSEGELWFTRSIFVAEGYMLVCIENLVQFGTSISDSKLSCPYYSLDSCCAIQDIIEMVIEPRGSRCLTLTLVESGTKCFTNQIEKERQPVETSKVHTWKLKWYSEDTLLKFIALLKAIHSGLTASPLPVKCIS
ncbi:hypothetical protein Cni_G18106 [Canna indica]|uniref:Serine/threonine-protein kinase 11-interacting protein n=1 Tax=Canna indica TaxID=4628 RepID=A0AAQ3KLL1_9LILI|nr:hypothetical protein Cni_G18106 [Canna indica]